MTNIINCVSALSGQILPTPKRTQGSRTMEQLGLKIDVLLDMKYKIHLCSTSMNIKLKGTIWRYVRCVHSITPLLVMRRPGQNLFQIHYDLESPHNKEYLLIMLTSWVVVLRWNSWEIYLRPKGGNETLECKLSLCLMLLLQNYGYCEQSKAERDWIRTS